MFLIYVIISRIIHGFIAVAENFMVVSYKIANGRIVLYVRYVMDMIFKKLKKYKKLVQSLMYIKILKMI